MWLLAAGRKVCGAVGWLWVCVVGLCRALTGRAAKQATSKPNNVGRPSPATGQEMEWEESWNTMEQFSVTVIPSDQLAASDQSDLFQDMQPILKKTRKVYVGGKESQGDQPDRRRFAVDAEFAPPDSVELGVWEDEQGEGGGWEEEMGEAEGALVAASREALAQQRREERDKRRKLQEALRFNQRRQPGSLGTRLSDSTP